MTLVRVLTHLWPKLMKHLEPFTREKVKEVLDMVIWAGMVALLLLKFLIRSFYIPSESMLPNLQVNDHILVNQAIYRFTEPVRGDVVVFHPPPTYPGDKADLIKRVVAVEHDTVEIRENFLYINNVQIQENFKLEEMEGIFGPERVKKAHVFVLGDNRNDSQDSRFIGQIPVKNVLGRAEIIFYPLPRIGLMNISR